MNLIKTDEKNNKILNKKPKLINSKLIFNGENNILICEENVVLNGSTIIFNGNNSIIYLSSNYNNYVVQKGDTLYSIARKYNITVDTIKKLNNLSSNTLSINQVLIIPS